jgi:succinate dehydrogenase / fumarate reductase iron-sulfur subunit
MAEFKILRYDPDKGGEPYFQSFQIPAEKGWTVLDGLFYILENLDPSLAFRSSCRAAACGSCTMHIHNEYNLACRTQIDKYGVDSLTIRPLSHMSILKDLVTDLKPFFDNYEAIKPYLLPKKASPQKEYLQSPEQRKKLDPAIDCILCAACYGSCPVAATDPKYLGPHAFLKALRFVEDSRDGETKQRLAFVGTDFGVFRCHTIFNCQKVCPKTLDPTLAIAKLKWKAIF